MRYIPIAAALALAACETSDNPADGGFISGVNALSTGAYDARIEGKEAEVRAGQAQQANLQAELASLRGEYDSVKLEIVRLRNAAKTSGATIPADLSQRVNATIISLPGGANDAERAANLRRAIADARALASELSNLTS